jgi:hypothetical protein
MINEEDLTVASLASLVGSELNVIDKYTESRGRSASANKLDPRAFLSKKPLPQRNPNVVRHDGMNFHAGVDESLVQSLYPEPVPQAPANTAQTVAAPVAAQPQLQPRPAWTPPVVTSTPTPAATQELVKILQSIDKTLKSIDKTEKTLAKLLTHLTTTNSDKDPSK